MVSRVLVVEDDPTVSEVVARYLTRAGYDVEVEHDGAVALERALGDPPDLVVLDVMLPGLDGLSVCRRLRERHPVPVVMLTALGESDERIAGLEVGADDYLTKPFSPRELVLRVAAVLRRQGPPTPATEVLLVDGPLRVDTLAREARLDGAPLALTVREFDLLAFLLSRPREAFTRAELLALVWGWDFGDSSTVTVHVRRLREKVEPDPAVPTTILTVWGVGYRYEPRARAGASTETPDGGPS